MKEKDFTKLTNIISLLFITGTPKDIFYGIIDLLFVNGKAKNIDKEKIDLLRQYYAIYVLLFHLLRLESEVARILDLVLSYEPFIGVFIILLRDNKDTIPIFVVESIEQLSKVKFILKKTKKNFAFVLSLEQEVPHLLPENVKLLGDFKGLGKVEARVYLVENRNLVKERIARLLTK